MEGGLVGHNFERDTPRDHLCQVWTLHRCFLPSCFRGEDVFNISQSEKKKSWRSCLLAEWNQMKMLHRGSYIDVFCQVWLHFAKQFQRRRFFKQQPIRNKNCPWQPYLLAKWNETKKLYRGPYIDASCQVWLHLAKQFQWRRFF